MRLQFLPTILHFILFPATIPFTPRPSFHQTSITQSKTSLYQYAYSTSYGIDDRSGNEKVVTADPEEDILSYIEPPEPVSDRPDLTGKVLVSGWANNKERSDQIVFDFLNDEESPFAFEEIVAFVADEKASKKRLLSRSARYTGLLNKLSFLQAGEDGGGLPSVDQLDGVVSWVANAGNDLETVKRIADLCSKSDVKYVSILMDDTSSLSPDAVKDALKALDANSSKCKYTVVAVGEIADTAEGSMPYGIRDFGTESGIVSGTYSRDESVRLVTNALALESGVNKAFAFVEVDTNCTEARLVKGLRETGYTRYQEIDHMITKGVAGYEKAIADYKQKKYELENPDPEEQARLQKERDEQDKLNWEKSEKEFEERKKAEIEEHATAWAKREYFRKSMGGNMGMTEEEYVKSVWDRAMFEGDLKYRMMHGGKTDERKELAEFLKKQEVKKEAALRKAKALLEDQLGTKLPDDDDDKDDE
mmetsp:Transcript_19173/g.23754  ORF Transcript_19173/g.23754 Transcript_19173/m.23754 type:complete len:477 (+) Transcript_19173:94-1524(+)